MTEKKMDENCYVESIYKNTASADQFQQADRATLVVWGMGCENCVTRVRKSLLSLEGVYGVDVYLNMALAEVSYDSKNVSANALTEAVSRAGNDGRHQYGAELLAAD
jgi:copper chaperone CopZ